MRIESIGLPGSGKTTVAKCVTESLVLAGCNIVDAEGLDRLARKKLTGFPVLNRQERTRQAIFFSQFWGKYPELFKAFQNMYGSEIRNMALVVAAGADISKYEVSINHPDSFWPDEALLHYLVHGLMLKSNWNATTAISELPKLLKLIPMPELIVFTEIDPEKAIGALSNRMEAFGRRAKNAEKRLQKSFGGVEGMIARASVLSALADILMDCGVDVLVLDEHPSQERIAVQATAPILNRLIQ